MAEADQKHLTRGRFNCTFYTGKNYPPQLKQIYDPPLVLYYRGVLPDHTRPLVAVVGTRRPTGGARTAAYALGFDLAGLGIATVSGLARGIDSEAHRGSLDAGELTCAVLGNGIDTIFPKESYPVARRILSRGGLIVSEYSPGILPLAYNFPARNRIISGLARAVVVVQAPARSGALITAEYALEQGRDLFVHRTGLTGAAGRGTQRLSEEGAPVIDGAAEITADWGWKIRDYDYDDDEAEKELPIDLELARLMELELKEKLSKNNGVLYLKRGL